MKAKIDTLLAPYNGSFRYALVDLYRKAVASDFIRKVMETFVSRILQVCIGLITTVLVARVLGPEGRGLYAVAAAISAMGVQFGSLGLHASNTYYVARNRELLPPLLGNTLVVSFGLCSIGVIIVWLIFTLRPALGPVHGMLLIIALASIPFGLAYLLMQNLLLGIQDIRTFNIIELGTKVFGVCLIVLVIAIGSATAERLSLAGLITLFLAIPFMVWRLKPHLRTFPFPSPVTFKENILYGLKAYVAALFAFLVLRIDLFLIKYLLGAQQTGYYSVAVTMVDMLYMLPVVVGTLLFPKLSSLPGEQDKWNLTKKAAIMIGITMFLLAGLSAVLAKPAVRLLFGKEFLPVIMAFVWLLPGIVMLSVNVIYMNYFASTGMPLITVYSPAIAAIGNIILNVKMIPAWGIIGASVASTISYGLMLVASVLYIFYTRRSGVL